MQKIAVIAAVLTLSGCATCHEHPGLCATGAVILGNSIALSVGGPDHHTVQTPKINTGNPNCSTNPKQCQ